MKALNLPVYTFKFKTVNQKTQIFDDIRKKYVQLTPEEWVRQNFISFLRNEKKYPASLISVEAGLIYNRQRKRTDIVIYSTDGIPYLIVECKAPEVEIKNETFEQVSRYNMSLNAKFIVVTNGLVHFCLKIDFKENKYIFLDNIPPYL